MTPHRFRSSQFQDCASILPLEMCEELELRRLARGAQPHVQPGLYSMRGGSGDIAPGAVVVRRYGDMSQFKIDGHRLPIGWSPVGSKRVRKHSGGRFSIVWKRDGNYRIQLLDRGMHYIPTTGKLSYQSVMTAIQVAESFLAREDSDFMPLSEGRAIREKSGGHTMRDNPTPNLRRLIRASTVGYERSRQAAARSAPTLSPILKRVNVAPKPKPRPRPRGRTIQEQVNEAITPILAEIERLSSQIETAQVARSKRREPTIDYDMLSRLGNAGVLQVRSRARLASGPKMVVRHQPNVGCASRGSSRPIYRETIKSAVRRSMNLSGVDNRPSRRGYSVREACAISQMQVDAAVGHVQANPVGQRVAIGFKSRFTGGSYPTRELRDKADAFTAAYNENKLIPLEKPLSLNARRMIPLGELTSLHD